MSCCLIVVWSLVTIAAERYLAVCQPFKHNEFTIRKVLLFYVVIYFMAVFINSTAAFEVSLKVEVKYFWVDSQPAQIFSRTKFFWEA